MEFDDVEDKDIGGKGGVGYRLHLFDGDLHRNLNLLDYDLFDLDRNLLVHHAIDWHLHYPVHGHLREIQGLRFRVQGLRLDCSRAPARCFGVGRSRFALLVDDLPHACPSI